MKKAIKITAVLMLVVFVAVFVSARNDSLVRHASADQEQELVVVLYGKRILAEMTDSFQPGDELSQFSKNSLFGTVEKVEVKEALKGSSDRDGNIVYSPLPLRRDLYITVKARGFKDSFGSYIIDNNRMLVGREIYIDNGRSKMYVTVCEVREAQ